MEDRRVWSVLAFALLASTLVWCRALDGDRAVQAQDTTHGTLPRAVRPGVKAAMSRHAEHASALTVAVALGSYDQTIHHVEELLAEPRPAPPTSDDLSTMNQLLPAQLLELDDRFRAALRRLRDAAQAHDDEQSIAQLGAVVRTCRTCHRALASDRDRPGRTYPQRKANP